MPSRNPFDPDKAAYYEKAGWEAYYDRKWTRVLRLMVQLNREQFHMSLFTAMAAALDIIRASKAFAPLDNDLPTATRHLASYFSKVRKAAGLETDAVKLAELEMDYWVVHRQLAIARRLAANHEGDIEPMVASFEKLHAALFDAPPDAIRKSAEMRGLAAATVDRITGGYSDNVEADWRETEEYLRHAYRALS